MNERTNRGNSVQFDEVNEGDLYDIEVTRKKVEDAIDELDENSTAGPDGIPAIFLKNTKLPYQSPLHYY